MAAGPGNQGPVGIVVVVVVVVLVLVVVVDALVVVVFGAVEGGALVCGRVGSGGAVGPGAALRPAVVGAIGAAPLVPASARSPPSATGPALEPVVVEATVPTPESIVSGPIGTAWKVVLKGEVRSAPVSSSQPGPQPLLRLTSANAPVKARAAAIAITDVRSIRRSRQRRAGRGTAGTTRSDLPRSWTPWGGTTSRRWPVGSGVGWVGLDPARATDRSRMENGRVRRTRL